MHSCSCTMPTHSITKPKFTGVASQQQVRLQSTIDMHRPRRDSQLVLGQIGFSALLRHRCSTCSATKVTAFRCPLLKAEALRVGYFFSRIDHLTKIWNLLPTSQSSIACLSFGHASCSSWVGESMVCKSVFFGIDLSLALNGVLR